MGECRGLFQGKKKVGGGGQKENQEKGHCRGGLRKEKIKGPLRRGGTVVTGNLLYRMEGGRRAK